MGDPAILEASPFKVTGARNLKASSAAWANEIVLPACSGHSATLATPAAMRSKLSRVLGCRVARMASMLSLSPADTRAYF
eukprot:13232417-Alexandrium_andersonii.AAC.1